MRLFKRKHEFLCIRLIRGDHDTGLLTDLHSSGDLLFLCDGNALIRVEQLLCGLCDAFDGKVARTKSDRTELETLVPAGAQVLVSEL